MAELNAQQLEAIRSIDGPLLVIAGAGSGKTRVITHKIAYLIEKCGFAPKHIYALTFTNKAAKEMSLRAKALLTHRGNDKIHVSTFHSLGLDILKRECNHLGLSKLFTLFDSVDSVHLLKELSGNVAVVSDENIKSIQQQISSWKNQLIIPESALSLSDEATHLAARFFIAYEKALRAYNAVDFDDLISLPVKLFQEHPTVLETWQNKIRYLLIDEYQDTNIAQYRLIKLLAGVRSNFTAVGDDDQSIYAWRGANPENIYALQQDYPYLKVIKLEQNYRSTRLILRAANTLISHNPHVFEKKLWSALGEGTPIRILATQDGQSEIERILHELLAHKFRYGLNFDDYAILYRSNHQARGLEQALRLQGIPYQISGGTSFFDRAEIKDLFAYFRLMINPKDDAAFLRCVNTPRRDIGPTTLEKLGNYAKERQVSLFLAATELGLQSFLPTNACQRLEQFATLIARTYENAAQGEAIEIVEEFISDIDYYNYLSDNAPNAESGKKRIDNIKDFLAWLKKMTTGDAAISFEEAIQKMVLIDILDRQANEQKTHALQLLTLHAAKGLEFPHVFIMGWEEECLPHKNSIELETIEEERRLAYVGITRAKESLVLTYAKQRKRFGEMQSMTPSRFLAELPQELLAWEGLAEENPEKQRASGQAHLAALRAMLGREN